MHALILLSTLIATYLMVIAKRIPALIRSFRYQSFFLFLATFISASAENHFDLFVVSGLLFVLKVIAIPNFLFRIVKRLKINGDLGLFLNAQLSLACALGFTYLSWVFTQQIVVTYSVAYTATFTVAFSIVLMGMFMMIFRMTAIAQIIGLLVMENGLFLLASSVSGGMPFFVEIAIFFDVLVSVIILGLFVFKINRLFTHIDVNRLTSLKG